MMKKLFSTTKYKILSIILIIIISTTANAESYSDQRESSLRKSTLTVVSDNQEVKEMVIYQEIGRFMVPLKEIVSISGLSLDYNEENNLFTGWLETPEQKIQISLNNHTVIFNGKEKKFSPATVQEIDNEIYIESHTLSTVLPINLVIDVATGQIIIANLIKEKANKNKIKNQSGQEKKKQNVTVSMTKDSILSEENLWIIDVYINSVRKKFFEIYRVEEITFLPLLDILALLEYPTERNEVAQTVEGKDIEGNTFSIDIKNRVSKRNNEKIAELYPILSAKNEVWINSEQLKELLDIELELDFGGATLKIETKTSIASERKKDRHHNWEKIQKKREDRKKNQEERRVGLQKVEAEKKLLSWPSVSVKIAPSYDTDRLEKGQGALTLNLTNEVAGYSTFTALSGTARNGIEALRMTGKKESEENKLLGPLKASKIEVGDTRSITVPLISSAASGAGIMISSKDVKRSSSFDKTTFVGDIAEGWEVELYRNSELLDFQIVGNEAQYVFTDVPLLFGNNQFRLIFYGPNGETKEKVESFYIKDNFLKEGEFSYEASLNKINRKLFNIEKDKEKGIGRWDILSNIEYGITKNYTLNIGGGSRTDEEKTQNYALSGLRANLGPVIVSTNAAIGFENMSWANQWQLFFVNKGRELLTVDYRLASNFESAASGEDDDHVIKSTLSHKINLPFINNISYRFSGTFRANEEEKDGVQLSSSISKRMLGYNINNRLFYDKLNNKTIEGNVTIRKRDGKNGTYRGRVDYSVQPRHKIKGFRLTANKRLEGGKNTVVTMTRSNEGSPKTTISGALNWIYDAFKLGFSLEVDNKKDLKVLSSIVMAFQKSPTTNKWYKAAKNISNMATVIPVGFTDENNNNRFDEGEHEWEKLPMQVNGRLQYVEKGRLMEIRANKENEIRVDSPLLDGFGYRTVNKGYLVSLRPGNIKELYFPIMKYYEVDGLLFYTTEEGEEEEVRSARVEVVDEGGRVVATGRTGVDDGFFSIERIPAGTYKIVVNKEDLKMLNAEQIDIPTVTLTSTEGEMTFNEYDIYLRPATSTAVKEQEKQVSKKGEPVQQKIKTFISQNQIEPLYRLVLGTFSSLSEAKKLWKSLIIRHKPITKQYHVAIETTAIPGKPLVYHLYINDIAGVREGEVLCKQVKRTTQSCKIIRYDEQESAPLREASHKKHTEERTTYQQATVNNTSQQDYHVILGSYQNHSDMHIALKALQRQHNMLVHTPPVQVKTKRNPKEELSYHITMGNALEYSQAQQLCNRLAKISKTCLIEAY